MANWTAADIPDQSGRRVIVTGANSGLGYQTALELARHRAHVVLACRDPTRGEEALVALKEEVPAAAVELAALDLADLASVRTFAKMYQEANDGLDLLINNAGVMAIPRGETVDGFERQFGTNHLGHFALTGSLLASLIARRGSRIVTVSSAAARIGRINFDDLQTTKRYSSWLAYGQSKLANQLFAFELDRRAKAAGLDLVSVSAHPGYAATNLGAGTGGVSSAMERLVGLGNRVLAQSDAAGALPTLYGACAEEVAGGEYFGPNQLGGIRGHPVRVPSVRAATDTEVARRLWEVSTQLTGVDFGLLTA